MILEEHRDNPDQINPIDQINQDEVQALRVHQADLQEVALHQIDLHLHVHQVDQADLHLQIDHLHRVHRADLQEVVLPRVHQVVQADLADPVVQVVTGIEVRDQVEVAVHVLEKMRNAMIAELN